MRNRSSENDLPTRRTTNTQTFLETCVLDDPKALEEHLMSNPVQQSDLDRCLLRGLQIVSRKERELLHVAQTLTLLLYSGARWNEHTLFVKCKTPLHIISQSPGDHHELLDLIFKSSQRTSIDTQDTDRHTAMMYAVKNANINCLKCLIANGADVAIEHYVRLQSGVHAMHPVTPITAAICMLSDNSEHSSVIMSDIFDLLLDTAVKRNKDHFRLCTGYVLCARLAGNVTCMMKLIKMGAPLDAIAYRDRYVWELAASMGNVELLKYMFNHGIDKNTTTNHGSSILGLVVGSGNIDAVRYLLDLGVAILTFTPTFPETKCRQCRQKILIMDDDIRQYNDDPCLRAIRDHKLDIVKLLDEYGSESCKSFYALRHAVKYSNVEALSYLLNKHTYPLNMEYTIKWYRERTFTLLTDPSTQCTAQCTQLLLDHGAATAETMCAARSVNIIVGAITNKSFCKVEIIAQYIRSGVDMNSRSGNSKYGHISPLEASILQDCSYISVMLLFSGCSRGVFGNLKFKPKPELEKLMKKWNVMVNNITTLKQRCRSVILNYLSTRADMKIEKLPLPGCLIKYLSIPELDNIVYEYYNPSRY